MPLFRPGQPRVIDGPEVIFDDDFRDGLQGWSGLRNAGENYYPSLYPANPNSPYSMILDTVGGVQGVTASAAKRWHAREGVLRWWIRCAWNALNTVGVESNGLRDIQFCLDWQKGPEGGDRRRWWELRYRHFDETGAVISPLWQITDGSAGSLNTIEALTGLHEFGYNELGKFDFQDIIITLDTKNDQWISLQINEDVYNLTGMPHAGTQPRINHFEYGGNCVINVRNRSNNSTADPFLLVGRTKMEVL